jgi:hypothetical protein
MQSLNSIRIHHNSFPALQSPDTIRTSSTSAFESMSLKPDHQVLLLPLTLNMSLPNQTGLQHMLLNPGGKHSSSDDTLFDQSLNADDSGNRYGNRENQDQQLKHPRAELEHNKQNQVVSDDHSSHLKRYKNHTVCHFYIRRHAQDSPSAFTFTGRIQTQTTIRAIATPTFKPGRHLHHAHVYRVSPL